ncbi:2-amino-4-hydroxy-6-hydroxymethyldihydropteridine diphosphokinase [Romeria aff. gracilis LEGE 07310]|uniref:2-amino-4-hydroxy-6-hydroxymethyldihydropteridine diphosphokinase n=1 Tax=Vasconcelosia minhoensis LEGE 07310 TaxID=915328 RepID=A0A8J7ACC0_9CYAN|nr:2-amino-4-hydroxy-6-hydroxymethyldihydropteridine diphosphokinase [Romeria gracilis]MBE9077069.1 2-amino-4-hydroxy-6-hydroxymethyldihydropteridine diphosphokinase [Romeria aff. gracilis LEGE 07310]
MTALSNQTIDCAIALGSNLGDSRATLLQAIELIDQTEEVEVKARSRLYQTAAVGPPQPDYLNACALLRTTLLPHALLSQLLAVETSFGRVRRERWGPRTLDIDLLLYGDWVIELPGLSVPHPRLHERPFVLVPLSEIAPMWQHPLLDKSLFQLAEAVGNEGVARLEADEPER